MQFNSYLFLLCFLPLFLIFYFLLSRLSTKLGNLFLLLASCAFYLFAGRRAFLLLVIDLLLNAVFIFGLNRTEGKVKKLLLAGSVIANILLLFYFKYWNFFIESIDAVFSLDLATRDILLPLGISFFTFQQIGYLVDTWRGKTKEYSFFDYLLFLLYFPKLAMGPITKAEVLIPQLKDPEKKRFQSENFLIGIRMFTLGLAKKVLIAETFATAVSYAHYYEVFGLATSGEILLILFGYTFEIYFDFSGYTDMAAGIAKMMNLMLAENFNSPYQALSIRDFWKRWHMSLTGFLTEYLYIPLGGNRKGTARTYLNTMIVFLVSGFWHGANWTFVLWGALHGAISVLERIGQEFLSKIPKAFRWLGTFLIGAVLWLLFQADSVTAWGKAFVTLFTSGDFSLHETVPTAFLTPEATGVLNFIARLTGMSAVTLASAKAVLSNIYLFGFFALALLICLLAKNVSKREYPNDRRHLVGSALLLVFCIVSLGSESVFIYNNF